jgi:hypothetical protein
MAGSLSGPTTRRSGRRPVWLIVKFAEKILKTAVFSPLFWRDGDRTRLMSLRVAKGGVKAGNLRSIRVAHFSPQRMAGPGFGRKARFVNGRNEIRPSPLGLRAARKMSHTRWNRHEPRN